MDNVRNAVGRWMGGWHAGLLPITPQMDEYAARALAKSVAFVPGRMIDSATDMLNLWIRNDTDSAKPTKSHKLPMTLLAMATETPPSGRDWGINVTHEIFVSIAQDPKERVFQMKTQLRDVRLQVAFFAQEPETAGHLSAQLCHWVEGYRNKHFSALWPFAGMQMPAPITLESDDLMPQRIPVESKNLSIMTVDVTLKVLQTMYFAPKPGEANDGKGSGTKADPHGFPITSKVEIIQSIAPPSGSGSTPLSEHSIDASGIEIWTP